MEEDGGDDDDDEEEEEKDDDFALEFAIGDQLIIFWNECFALVTPTFPLRWPWHLDE